MDALERMRADLGEMLRWIGAASPGASVLELAGVLGAVVPATPDRSVFNSLVYEDAAALERALPEIAAAYEAAGVRAWTVWMPEADAAAREALARAGNVLDASPAAMVCELGAWEPPPIGDLDWTADADIAEVARINDLAYGFEGTPFTDACRRLDEGGHAYLALLDGRPACGLVTIERDPPFRGAGASAGIFAVATLPEARGRGLTVRLLGQALADAHERGCSTSTLQATKMGAPVYDRLGYRSLGAIEMWERRRPA